MGKSFRGKDRKKHRDSYLRFKDKRQKRVIKDDDESKREGKKENRYNNYDDDSEVY